MPEEVGVFGSYKGQAEDLGDLLNGDDNPALIQNSPTNSSSSEKTFVMRGGL